MILHHSIELSHKPIPKPITVIQKISRNSISMVPSITTTPWRPTRRRITSLQPNIISTAFNEAPGVSPFPFHCQISVASWYKIPITSRLTSPLKFWIQHELIEILLFRVQAAGAAKLSTITCSDLVNAFSISEFTLVEAFPNELRGQLYGLQRVRDANLILKSSAHWCACGIVKGMVLKGLNWRSNGYGNQQENRDQINGSHFVQQLVQYWMTKQMDNSRFIYRSTLRIL